MAPAALRPHPALPTEPDLCGCYGFGRTGTHVHIEPGRPCKRRGRRQRREEWIVLLRDHHESYIAWDRYECHEQMLAGDTNRCNGEGRGASRGESGCRVPP